MRKSDTTNGQSNLGYRVVEYGLKKPKQAAFRTDITAIPSAVLSAAVVSIAGELRRRGVDRTSCVAIAPNFLYFELASVLAVALLGAKCVRLTRNALASRDKLALTHALLAVAQFPSSGELAAEATESLRAMRFDANWFRPSSRPDPSILEQFPGYSDPEDVWIYLETSGTTGTPKFVPNTYSIVFKRAEHMRENHRTKGQRHAILFPVFSAFLPNYIAVLLNGGTLLLSDAGKVRPNVVLGSPALVSTFLTRREGQGVASKIDWLYVAGAKVPDAMIDRIRQHFGRVCLRYGSTEAGYTCYNEFRSESEWPGNRWKPIDNCLVQSVQDGKELPRDQIGEIRIKTPYMIDKYLDEDQQIHFRDGWFYPGDMGSVGADGTVSLTGRSADLLNIGGEKHNAVLLDETVQAAGGVVDAVCFEHFEEDGRPALGVIVKVADDAETGTIPGEVVRKLQPVIGSGYVVRVFLSGEIPRTPTGKPRRPVAAEIAKDMEPA